VRTDVDVTDDQSLGSDESTLSGDTQGLPEVPDATFESVKELTEEGQYLEAELVDGVENAIALSEKALCVIPRRLFEPMSRQARKS
jgi:hypothetical protein